MNSQKGNPYTWPLLIGLVAVFILGLVIATVSQGRPSLGSLVQVTESQALSATETSVLNDTPTPDEEMTDEPTPDETATQNFLATDSAWKQIVAITADYLATTLPSPIPIATGIYDDQTVKAQLGKEGYAIENAWFGILSDTRVAVYAGAPKGDLTQGVLHIFLFSRGNFEENYFTPVNAGAVHVVAEQNNRLTLLSTDGTTFYFDVPGLRFVDSLTEVAPTITPFMTETPFLTWTPGPIDTPLPTETPGPSPTPAPTELTGTAPVPVP